MIRKFSVLFILFLSACGGSTNGGPSSPSPNPPPPNPPPSGPVAPNPGDNSSFATMLNNVRTANSAGAVAYDERLGRAAQKHANDMHNGRFLSHTGSDGSDPGDRITREGYRWRTYGENIAQGQQSQQEVLDAWTSSPGHHANNINPNFEDFGLAKAGSGNQTYWVLVLAAER